MYIPFFKQQENWDCSIACVTMISEYFHKKNINYNELINKTNFYQDLNLIEIEELGKKMNLTLISYFVKWEQFLNEEIKNPIICQVKNNEGFHFIVIFKKNENKLLIANPEKNEIEWIEKEKLKKIYTNIIITSSSKKFSINELLKEKIGLNFLQKLIIPIIYLLIIGIISTILTITLQFLIKIIIDEILIKKNSSQIPVFFISFFLIFFINLLLNLIFEKLKFKIEIHYKKKWNLLFFQRLKLLNYINLKKYSLTTILKKYKYFNEIINFYFPNLINILHNFFFIISSITIFFFFFLITDLFFL